MLLEGPRSAHNPKVSSALALPVAQLGMVEALLHSGDIADAHREADDVLASAISCADRNMHALAWEMKSRVARAEKDFDGARLCNENALAILERVHNPVTAWQVHRTAWDLYTDEANSEKANRHRARARELIERLADSFDYNEPLRETLLAAPPARRVLVEGSEGLSHGNRF
jgi:hypothetical protein